MKKIKLCVVGLLLSGVVYGNDTTSVSVDTKERGELKFQILNMIEDIQYDMYYGYIPHNQGNYYVNLLLSMLPKPIDSWCENCDEID
tara:strand:+ start:295 stop:555 length:261 start_codon:yes stop_codon:yes gene_type:complete